MPISEEGAAERDLAQLLELLAEEAPAEAFNRLGEEVAGRADEENRDLVLLFLARAERIRGLLTDRKRREREMQALLDTARDLASLHELDPVLEAIIARARQLLGTDAAYLALIDAVTGEVYMRVTLGTITPAIESVRQPLGCGVGGRVVQSGQPFATSNYLHDEAIERDPAISDAVAADGLVSILGVPLRVGDEVVGVLFGANREERTFEDSEVALLGSLADHASILLENARLFTVTETTARELRTANDQLAQHNEALERAARAHEELMAMVLRRAELAELVEAVAGALDGAVAAVKPDGTPLTTAGTRQNQDLLAPLQHSFRLLEGLAAPDRPGSARHLGPLPGDSAQAWAVPIQAGTETFGHLFFARRAELLGTEVRLLERSAQTAALLLLVERQLSAAEQQVRGELVDELLGDREPDWGALQRRAKASGALDLAAPQTVLVLSATRTTRRRLLRAAADFAGGRGGVATEHAGYVVLLLPRIDETTAARSVPEHLEKAVGGEVTAAAAGPATSVPEIRALHREAERCHRLLVALGRTGTGASREDLGVLGLVLDGTSREQMQQLVDDTVGPLLAYDDQHGAMLTSTLDGYFAAGQNPRAAARALRVHPNTVYQRLGRVDQVLGHRRWREAEGALTMRMALQLRHVLEQMSTKAPVGS